MGAYTEEALAAGDEILDPDDNITDPDAVQFLDGDDLDGLDEDAIDPSRLRLVSLLLKKHDGDELRMRFLRSVEWLTENKAEVGQSIELDLTEFGAAGKAEVVSIEPCPAIGPRPSPRHHLVTGTFAHQSSRVFNLHIAGQPPLGVTGNHPFWSVDRRAFIPAERLRPGESLRLADRSSARVLSLSRDYFHTSVYNVEVAGAHVYHVGPAGVLVHNGCNQFAQIRGALSGRSLAGYTRQMKGLLGEARAAAAMRRAGYERLASKLPSNHGIDGIWVKRGLNGDVTQMVLLESKFSKTGQFRLAGSGTTKQMSNGWINQKLVEMTASGNPALIRSAAEVTQALKVNRVVKVGTVLSPNGKMKLHYIP